jgi:hypothetical protein
MVGRTTERSRVGVEGGGVEWRLARFWGVFGPPPTWFRGDKSDSCSGGIDIVRSGENMI